MAARFVFIPQPVCIGTLRNLSMATVEIIPSARRLVRSLRDMGYDFTQAVADVIDNSIEAGASVVNVDAEFDGDSSWVRIADNGCGMKPDELREALRFGSNRRYDDDDLGKFGLGLKTASLSQCQCLSVASRWNHDRADIAAYSWDLDHIQKTDRWEIMAVDRDGIGPSVRNMLKDGRGTVVLWHRLDRLLGYRHPYGEAARKRLQEMCRGLELHLGMVFERFLNGKTRGKKLKIMLNGNPVQPWDPFCRDEPRTKVLQSVALPIDYEGVKGSVLIEPYVLPHQDDFSSPESFRRASGPASWNQQQGFYVYRAQRMIQSGGWSNLRAPDEHTKLARVAVSFAPALDEAFKINVAKMRVQMPTVIREEIRQATASVMKLAREVYDRKTLGGRARPPATTALSSGPVNGASTPAAFISPTSQRGNSSTNPNAQSISTEALPTMLSATEVDNLEVRLSKTEWAKRLLSAATAGERPVVERVLHRMDGKTP
jgi:hypothetical protein